MCQQHSVPYIRGNNVPAREVIPNKRSYRTMSLSRRLWDYISQKGTQDRNQSSCRATLACSWPCVHHEHDGVGDVDFTLDYEKLSVAASAGCVPCGFLKQGVDAVCVCTLRDAPKPHSPHSSISIEYGYRRFFGHWNCAETSDDEEWIPIDIRSLQGRFPYDTTKFDRQNDDAPLSEPSMGEIHCDPLSPPAIRLYRRWLSACDDGHKACQQDLSSMPTRILDLRPARDGDDCVCLVSSNGLHDRYVALSYCWGDSRPPSTTTLNRRSYEQGISCRTLPQTYRDAVNLCRKLGFRYLWIDSICITQDDDKERAREILKMDQIFYGATLVVIAGSAESVDEGFLSHRSSGLWSSRSERRGPESVSVQVRARIHIIDGPTDCSFETPISERGWTYQERKMARRSIVFHKDEAIWECGESCECECSLQCTPFKPQRLEVSRITARNAQFIWWAAIREFSRGKLSVPTDRLSAIAAVGDYVAGLWRNNLLPQLLWQVDFHYDRRRRWGPRAWRQHEYQSRRLSVDEVDYPDGVAPTFSWAACVGPIFTGHVENELSAVPSHDVNDATVIQVSYVSSSINGFGHHRGVLVLESDVCEAAATYTKDCEIELLSKSGLRLPRSTWTKGLEWPVRSAPAPGDDEDTSPSIGTGSRAGQVRRSIGCLAEYCCCISSEITTYSWHIRHVSMVPLSGSH